jgi:hypothetical protein
MKLHKLASGLVIGLTSPHGQKFSDGTEAVEGATMEFSQSLSVKRDFQVVQETPFRATESTQFMTEGSLELLRKSSDQVDIVLVPFMLLAALKTMGLRSEFPKVVAFNATKETSRSAPQEKVVDVDNWAW